MPNLKSTKEQQQWMEGKASRTFVLQEVNKIYQEFEMIGEELKRSSLGFSQVFQFSKMLGMQVETLIRMLNDAVPEFKTNFTKEFQRTISLTQFIESLNNFGSNSSKPMAEKIDLAKSWNAAEGNLPVSGVYFGLPEYILNNIKDFSEEELSDLCSTLDMSSYLETFKNKKKEKPLEVEEINKNVVDFPVKVEGTTNDN
jgi:hypothetical protein